MFAQTLEPIDCHGSAMGMYNCALENIIVLVARKTESAIATDHELSVGVSYKDPVRNRRNFFVHITLSYSKRRRGCLVLCKWM